MYLDRILSTHRIETEELQKLAVAYVDSKKFVSILFLDSVRPLSYIPGKISETVCSRFRGRPERIVYLGACFSSLAIAAASTSRVALTLFCAVAAAVCFKLILQNLQHYQQHALMYSKLLDTRSPKAPCNGCRKLAEDLKVANEALKIANNEFKNSILPLEGGGTQLSEINTRLIGDNIRLQGIVDRLSAAHEKIVREGQIMLAHIFHLSPDFSIYSAHITK